MPAKTKAKTKTRRPRRYDPQPPPTTVEQFPIPIPVSQRIVETTVDTNPLKLPEGLPFARRETNAFLLREAQRVAGIELEYPIGTREAFGIIGVMGYDIDRECLDHCLKMGYWQPSHRSAGKAVDGISAGGYAWYEDDIITLADALESLRRWLPLHPCHKHKLTTKEMVDHTIKAKAKATVRRMPSCTRWTYLTCWLRPKSKRNAKPSHTS